MKLAKYFTRVVASIEAQEREEILHELHHGDLSDQAMAIESQRDGAAELAVATVESLHAARRMDSDASELCELERHAQSVRDTVETVNALGGFSIESMQWANRAIQAVLAPAVPNPPQLSAAAEAFADGLQVLSLEGLDQVIQTIGEVRADVEAKSVDGILRVFEVLKDAMPEVKDRLIALKQALPATAYNEDAEIRLDDLVFKSLAVDGVIPSSLGSYLATYAEFANCILSSYSENALESASKTPLAAEAMAGLGDGCPIKALAKVYCEIGDPRNGIPADQLCFAMPGSGPLFGNKVDATTDEAAAAPAEAEMPEGAEVPAVENMDGDVGADDLVQRLQQYCTSRAPLDPLSYADRASADGENPTIRVLSKDTIAKSLCELIKAFEVVDIKSFAEARRQTWVQARSAYGAFQQQLVNIQPSQVATVRQVAPALAEYLDIVFALSAWPALHLLTNMVFTANGFLLLAERSISGKSEEVPAVTDAPMDEEAEAAADPTAVPPVEDPAAEDPAAAVDADATAPADVVPAEDGEVPAADGEASATAEEPAADGASVDAPEGVDVNVNVNDSTDEAPPADASAEEPPVADEETPPAEEPAADDNLEAEEPAVPEVEEEEDLN